MNPPTDAVPHRWKFYRAGGVDQVRLDTGADILKLGELDQKLWVALSCPVKGLEFDERTLALLDADGDGFVRPPEILASIKWLGEVLKNPDDLVKGPDGVPLANINDANPEGARVLSSAKHILQGLGKEKAVVITVGDTLKTAEVFAKARHNGDGVVPPEAIEDAAARQVAQDIIACFGGAKDRGGAAGISQAQLDQCFAECKAFADWNQRAESDTKTILPLGGNTAAAFAAFETVRAKVDDYFGRCRLAAFDPRAQAALNREESLYLDIAAKDLSITAQEVIHFPLAIVAPSKPLPLGEGVNPAWGESIARFTELCVAPLVGKDKTALGEADWSTICQKLTPHGAWARGKAGAAVEKLGVKRVREILAGKSKEILAKSIAADLAVAPEVDAMLQVERLTRLYRDLHHLLRNYVSFSDFYSRRKAIFQAGTLYLDGRSCDLCVNVNDPAKHGLLAAMAKTYLAYVDCSRPSGAKIAIAAAFTAGNSDNLFVGRNGLFYDRKGRDWNATITKIIDNPISIRQAFFSPYKKLLRWIEETVAKRAAAADEAASARMQSAATSTAQSAQTGKAPAEKPKLDIGVVAALGVAVGGITAAMGVLLQAFFGLGMWLPLGLVGLIFLISGPSMLIAYLKLRQRNLGPILDANGWAVNTLTKVNLPLGRALTDLATVPPGAERSLKDPYAEKKSPWPKVILLLLVLAGVGFGLWKTGYLNKWLPDVFPAPAGHSADSTAPGDVPAPADGAPK